MGEGGKPKCPSSRRGNVYWYHVWFSGQHIQESTKQGNPKLARTMEAAHRTRLVKAAAGIEEPMLSPRLGEFAEEFLKLVKVERKPQTYRRYSVSLVSLKEAFGNKRLSEITPEEIDRYKQSRLNSGRKGSTINRDLACLRPAWTKNHPFINGQDLRAKASE